MASYHKPATPISEKSRAFPAALTAAINTAIDDRLDEHDARRRFAEHTSDDNELARAVRTFGIWRSIGGVR